jgi:hypothetical protein
MRATRMASYLLGFGVAWLGDAYARTGAMAHAARLFGAAEAQLRRAGFSFNAVMQLSPGGRCVGRARSAWRRCIHTRVERGVRNGYGKRVCVRAGRTSLIVHGCTSRMQACYATSLRRSSGAWMPRARCRGKSAKDDIGQRRSYRRLQSRPVPGTGAGPRGGVHLSHTLTELARSAHAQKQYAPSVRYAHPRVWRSVEGPSAPATAHSPSSGRW